MPKKIIIVDDDPGNVKLLETIFKKEAYEVSSCLNGVDGLVAIKTEKPDLVILDVMMPKLDGYQVCRMLKFDGQYKDIPIIMLTSRNQEEDRSLSAAVKADAFINKPVQADEILATVKKLIA